MILSDLHTHTRYSDGKNTVEEMVIAARQKGLKQIGITEHGLRHFAFGIHRNELYKLRKEVDELNARYDDIEVLMGIEANIYGLDGSVDLRKADYELLDYVAAGYHMACFAKSIGGFLYYNFKGVIGGKFSQRQIDAYTKAFISVIKAAKVRFITHPDYRIPVHVDQIAQAAADYGVALELNGKKVSMTDEEVAMLFDGKAEIIVNSDGHSIERLGDFSVPMGVVDRLNLDKNRIINWNNTVKFRK